MALSEDGSALAIGAPGNSGTFKVAGSVVLFSCALGGARNCSIKQTLLSTGNYSYSGEFGHAVALNANASFLGENCTLLW